MYVCMNNLHAPNIGFLSIIALSWPVEQLWGCIRVGATWCAGRGDRQVTGEAKVGNLDRHVLCKEYVLALEVSVTNVVPV